MQQVGARELIASAELIDPRRLPALLYSPSRRALTVARHTWILHRPAVLRGAAIAVALIALLVAWETRDHLSAGVQNGAALVQAKLAEGGFAINEISISGQALTSEVEIFKALAVAPQGSTFAFDADAARARIAQLPAISSVNVRKVYPGHLDVVITERQPVARWRVDGVTYLVDGEGRQIAVDSGDFAELPLIVGDGAADDALVIIKAIERHAGLKSGLAALSRIGDRRWDLIYYTGLRVQLPEQGVGQALAALDVYQERYQLLERDVTLIDLRVPGFVTLKPGELSAEYLADKAKAAAKKK